MTVLEAIQKGADFLGKKHVESPRLNAELLLAQVLRLPRMKLYLNFDRGLAPAETDALRELIKRRGQREPLQHIVGSTSFCGLELAVSRHALIPRPETELLAELGWQFLRTRPAPAAAAAGSAPETDTDTVRALDFGTGTGCLAIVLARQCPHARITALDISAAALELARQNAAAHGVADRIEFLAGDGLAALPATAAGQSPAFDLILSNPPYIPSAEIATLEPEVRDFDPRAALDGGADGLDFYRLLARHSGGWLKPDGRVMLEFGEGQAAAIQQIFEGEQWRVEAIKEDYSHRARMLVAAGPPPAAA